MEKKQAQKPSAPRQTAPPQDEGPSTEQPPEATEEQMLSASAVAELLRLANPNVDWGTAMAAMGFTKKKSVATTITLTVTVPNPTPIAEPLNQPAPPTETLESSPPSPKASEPSQTPLDVSPISVYEPPTVQSLREEGERVLETEERADEGVVERSGGVEGEPTGRVGGAGVVEGVTGDERGEGKKGEKEKKGEEVDAEREVERGKKDEQIDPKGRDVET